MADPHSTYHDFDDKRIIIGLGAALALFVVFYVFRVLKVYVLGRRVPGVITEVVKYRGYRTWGYGFVVEYKDIRSGNGLVHEELTGSFFPEFKVGERVTLFVPEGKNGAAEILSWWRLLVSAFVVIGIALAMVLTYHFQVEK